MVRTKKKIGRRFDMSYVTYLRRIIDGIATVPFLCSLPSPFIESSIFIGDDGNACSVDDDEPERFVRRSSLVAMASQINGDNNEYDPSNSLTVPS